MKHLKQIFQALLGVVALIFTAIIAFGRLAWRTICNWWKNRSKWLRHSIVAISMLIPIGFAALVAHVIYEDRYGRDYCDRRISGNLSLHSFSDNKWRLYDKTTGKYLTGKINWLSSVSMNNSLAVYALPNKRGYIDVNTGRIVIDAETNNYSKAWIFSEGVAAVSKDGKIGFINAENEVVIPFQFDFPYEYSLWDFNYIFYNGYCAMTNADGDIGLIDRAGNWVVEPSYDNIYSPEENGYRITVKGDKCGILDSDCTTIYAAEYDNINIVSDGFILTKDGRMWQVDFDGNIVHPFLFDATYYIKYPNGYDSCGELIYEFADLMKYSIDYRYGIMNRITGEPITPAVYQDINMLSENLLEVLDAESYDWHLIDSKGNIVINE